MILSIKFTEFIKFDAVAFKDALDAVMNKKILKHRPKCEITDTTLTLSANQFDAFVLGVEQLIKSRLQDHIELQGVTKDDVQNSIIKLFKMVQTRVKKGEIIPTPCTFYCRTVPMYEFSLENPDRIKIPAHIFASHWAKVIRTPDREDI